MYVTVIALNHLNNLQGIWGVWVALFLPLPLCQIPPCPQFARVNEKYELDTGITGKNSQKPGWNIPFLKYKRTPRFLKHTKLSAGNVIRI